MNGSTVSYTYDAAGNITTITDGSLVTYYTYDSLNQLVREDNAYSNKTVVYAYVNGGNIKTDCTSFIASGYSSFLIS